MRSTDLAGLRHPSLLPPPRATMRTSRSLAHASTALTCSVDSGATTRAGNTPSTLSSDVAMRTAAIVSNSAPARLGAHRRHGYRRRRHLEDLRDPRRLKRMRNVRSWFIAAQAKAWKHLVRVRQMLRIEGATHQLHGIEIGFGIHRWHEVFLLLPNPVFAGDRPANPHAQPKDIA